MNTFFDTLESRTMLSATKLDISPDPAPAAKPAAVLVQLPARQPISSGTDTSNVSWTNHISAGIELGNSQTD